MIESGYYPAGAEFDPRAPYNQVDTPDKEFDITCCQVLSKTSVVTTSNYTHYVEEGIEEWDDTSDTNWADEYHYNDHYTPIQLIQILEEILMEAKEQGRFYKSKKFTEHLIQECSEWQDDKTEYTL